MVVTYWVLVISYYPPPPLIGHWLLHVGYPPPSFTINITITFISNNEIICQYIYRGYKIYEKFNMKFYITVDDYLIARKITIEDVETEISIIVIFPTYVMESYKEKYVNNKKFIAMHKNVITVSMGIPNVEMFITNEDHKSNGKGEF